MSKAKVIIVGCGIAGPVLATFLALEGYETVVYERLAGEPDGGIGLMLQANGLRVLSLLPDFDVNNLPGQSVEKLAWRSWIPEEQATLAEKPGIGNIVEKLYGHKMIGVERPGLQRMLVQCATDHGVRIETGCSLVSFEQGNNEVTVTFENGRTDKASFIIGCDGLHSVTRASLFGREKADFTGLTQTGGLTRTLEAYSKDFSMTNIYGNGKSLILYPISATHTSWAVTVPEDEAKETWREMNIQKQEEFKNGPLSEWGFEGERLIKDSEKLVKYGLYDRPELKTWHKERVVLLGDAAHPTSPHLGQGANQAFEDIYHLVRLLKKHNSSASAPSTDLLHTIFSEYEDIRIARTSELVKGARKMGEIRVVAGAEACMHRNQVVRKMYEDTDQMMVNYGKVLDGPYRGKSEI